MDAEGFRRQYARVRTLRLAWVLGLGGGFLLWAIPAWFGLWIVAAAGGILAGLTLVLLSPLVAAQSARLTRMRHLRPPAAPPDVDAVGQRTSGLAWIASGILCGAIGSVLLGEALLSALAMLLWLAATAAIGFGVVRWFQGTDLQAKAWANAMDARA